MTVKVLFVGGTGIISSACTELALARGYDLDLMVRGRAPRAIPAGVNVIQADIRNPQAAKQALAGRRYDAVVDWIAFETRDIEVDIELFSGRTDQFVFISSASAYKKPVDHWPIRESTPLHNPWWQYSRNKIACEERLVRAYREQGFPITIVRPSHTYDKTLLPFDPYQAGYTVLSRMRRNLPVIVHGDGTSLWVLTHHRDFAKGFVGLLAHPKAIGETFHITSDEVLTWNQIFGQVAHAARCEAKLVHVPSAIIAREHPAWGAGLLGDKTHSVIFDNTKIRGLVPDYQATIPFARGAEEIVAFYDEHPDFEPVNAEVDQLMDRLVERFA